MSQRPLKGWYRRGDQHPPHFDAGEVAQFITFRLADSLPQVKLRDWKGAVEAKEMDGQAYHDCVEDYLDAGYGHCWLSEPRIAEVVVETLLIHRDRYRLHGWVVMPNHVHVLITPNASVRLADLLHSWKSYTANRANRLIGRRGPFWQDDYFDRFIRDQDHFDRTVSYVAQNPVLAGLCNDAKDWLWSHEGRNGDGKPIQ